MEHEENVGSAVSMKVVDNTDVQQSMTKISHASTNTPTKRGGGRAWRGAFNNGQGRSLSHESY